MKILKEERAQGSAEYLLLFGGVIVIAVAAALWYKNYLDQSGNVIYENDVQNINKSLQNLTKKF